MQTSTIHDAVVIVDAADTPLRVEDKFVAHRYPVQRHRASSVWLWRHGQHGKEVLLQKRSQAKIVGAGWWANSACGNTWPGESAEACAERRLAVELGIHTSIQLQQAYVFEYQAAANAIYGEHEIDTLFIGKYDGEVVCNPLEVSQSTWVSWQDLVLAATAWRHLYQDAPDAASSLEHPLDPNQVWTARLQLHDHAFEITPWTMMMLFDERLNNAIQSA